LLVVGKIRSDAYIWFSRLPLKACLPTSAIQELTEWGGVVDFTLEASLVSSDLGLNNCISLNKSLESPENTSKIPVKSSEKVTNTGYNKVKKIFQIFLEGE
jgi:hypothetical protein